VTGYAVAKRLSKSADAKALPLASIILTCHPSLAHTLALATTTRTLTRSIRTVSLSRSATILYDNSFPFDLFLAPATRPDLAGVEVPDRAGHDLHVPEGRSLIINGSSAGAFHQERRQQGSFRGLVAGT
jgi:hypothetical protein